jgi:ABC-2 type transport system permease protein
VKQFAWQAVTDTKMLLRVPISMFFTVIFPATMLLIIVTSYGNVSIGPNLNLADKYVLIAAGMGVAPLTLITLPTWIANSFETNYLMRLRYFHVSIARVGLSNAVAHCLVALLGIVVNFAVAFIVYGIHFPAPIYLFSYLAELILAILAMMSFGAFLGFVFKRASVVLPLGLILMFILYMLCGVFGNYDGLPAPLKAASAWIPLKYVMIDAFDLWQGEARISPQSVGVSLLSLGVFGLATALTTRKAATFHVRMQSRQQRTA